MLNANGIVEFARFEMLKLRGDFHGRRMLSRKWIELSKSRGSLLFPWNWMSHSVYFAFVIVDNIYFHAAFSIFYAAPQHFLMSPLQLLIAAL